ncbi:FHS family L-fucose permease-like MFS transporter [Rhizomicrobium palustre]|uniref:FHS family L-fucose permease-like MFS transporter n=1 Tax=Rhizomicrobium palustre TaxID=189966 RepID=A0A846N1P1_9PROT|nr:MFS transporter [Rhizomicrobium palustre]NIK89409.1 FHS family L-fucose permease-like MFS transporter [Rhizomicrobium palustre]
MLKSISTRQLMIAYAAIAGLFVLAGVGFWNDILLFPKLAKFFGIDLSHALWIQTLYSLGYVLAALPSALFHRKYGYKIGMIFALSVVSIGPFLIFPAIVQHSAIFFFLAVALLGVGWSALETSLNPLAVEMAQPRVAVRLINFLQAFFTVGLMVGFIACRWVYAPDLHLSFDILVETAARPYVVVGLAVLLVAFMAERVELPARCGIREGGIADVGQEMRDLLACPQVKHGMAAIFACIALQSTLQGATYQYVMQQYPDYSDAIAQNIVFTGLAVFGIGRFGGVALMGRIDPNLLLKWGVAACAVLTLGAVLIGGTFGLVCVIATNLFLGIGYPTVLGTVLRDRHESPNIAAGLLVTASGLAGLIVPLAMNFLIVSANVRVAILLALPCFPLLYFYLLQQMRMVSPQLAGKGTAASS